MYREGRSVNLLAGQDKKIAFARRLLTENKRTFVGDSRATSGFRVRIGLFVKIGHEKVPIYQSLRSSGRWSIYIWMGR